MSQNYTFGDTDRAAARLALLANVFEPTTRSWLEALGGAAPACVVDLGCGPGHTTELVHTVLGARESWGLDASERLVARARSRLGPPFVFEVHDVTRAPMPTPPADLAYARHLLAHLPDPAQVLRACATTMHPGGRMVLEETAGLDSPDPVFAEYYACVAEMQRHYGQDTLVGLRLDTIAAASPWSVESFSLRHAAIDPRSMASLHAMNVRTWRTDPFAAATFDGERIQAMTDALDAVAAGARDAPPVTCTLGQAVLRIGAPSARPNSHAASGT
jgi:SAM-dependent methyltransferase